MIKYLIIFLLSGLISVDRNSALNIMISRPIFISMLIGIMFDNFYLLLLVGILFELIGLIDLPVGTHIPRDDSFMTYVTCLVFSHVNVDNIFKVFLLLLLVVVFSYPATFTESIVRKLNQGLYLKNRLKGYRFPITKVITWGIMISYFRGVIVYNILFFLLYYIYIQVINIKLNFIFNENITEYLILLICFVSGYLIRFLNLKSIIKYLVFIFGVMSAWYLI
ncbi:hypothetical protein OWM07_01685 [Deferribacter thermophilus]|uniref:hypothetical protein n=1 Tax=Deferribacter thermophilus TaxID=53573 RepID=UPI003C1D1A9B